jgi:hypothetical protein
VTGARLGRAARWGGGAAGLGAIVAIHLVLAWPVRVPLIHPDELGYLLDARVLARGGVRSAVEYYPGFSVLLVPLWLGGAGPLTVFRETHVVQAILGGVGALLLWELTRSLAPGLAGWRRVLVVGAVCAYPAELLYGDLALSEVAFATAFIGVILLGARAFTGRRAAPWLALGLGAGLLVAVHPRGLAVVAVTLVVGAVVLGWRRSSIIPYAGLLAGAFAGLAAARWLLDAVRAPTTQLGAYQPDSVLSKSLSVHGLGALIVEVAGQLFYLSVATVGLVPLGLAVGGTAAVRAVRASRAPRVLVTAYAALCFAGVWGLSSLFANLGDRADKLIYGRYNEGVIAPLLVIALADVLLERGARRWLMFGGGATVLTGAIVLVGDHKAALFGTLNPVNVLGVMPVVSRMGGHIHVVALAAIAAAAVIVLSLVAWRLPVVAVVVVVAVFVASAVDTETSYMIPGARSRAAQHDIASAILAIRAAGLGPDACVAYDPSPLGYGDYNFYEDQFLVPTQQFIPYESSSTAAPCGSLVVSRLADFRRLHPGAREVTAENFTDQVLWAVPVGQLYGVLAARGWLSPSTAAAPLPAAALAGGRLVAPPAVTVRGGASVTMMVRVEHGPGGAPWPSVDALHSGSGTYGVRLTVSAQGPGLVRSGDHTACVGSSPAGATSCRRVELPETLLPDQIAVLPLTVAAPAGTPPGRYLVHLGLVQEGVGSFKASASVIVIVTP